MTATTPPTLLDSKEVAAVLGVRVQTIRAWRVRGGGPRFTRLGRGRGCRIVYDLAEVQRWLERNTYASTSEPSGEPTTP